MTNSHASLVIRSHRRRWGLLQRELGELLGVSRGAITKMERLLREPSLYHVFAAEIVFGVAAKELFPTLHEEIEDEVVRRAQVLEERLSDLHPEARSATRALLTTIISRAQHNSHSACLQQPRLFE
jgi:transcriptional regulator with XRE-family HTH domain